RHTRSKRDWSSDVCSSDLKAKPGELIKNSTSGRTDSGVHALGQVIHVDYPAKIQPHSMRKALNSILDQSIRIVDVAQVSNEFHRSEERRVGKEGRSRWWRA